MFFSRLAEGADVQVKLRGDDSFGWMTISCYRELTTDEAALAATGGASCAAD